MPNVPVDDILIHPRDNDLIVGTHGRSIWVLDRIASLETLTPEAIRTEAFLVPPTKARLLSIYTPQAWYGAGQYFAPNPDFSAAVEYFLRSAPGSQVSVTVADSHGSLVRTLRAPARAGMNRVSWDLRMEPVSNTGRETLAGTIGGPLAGPLVLPGVYTVTVTVAGVGKPLKGELRVEGDPRVSFSDADRRSRQAALLTLYELEKSLSAARASSATARVGADTRLAQLQAEIAAELNTASALSRAIEGYSGLPTSDQRRQIEWVVDDGSKTVDALNRVLRTETPAPAQLMDIPAGRR